MVCVHKYGWVGAAGEVDGGGEKYFFFRAKSLSGHDLVWPFFLAAFLFLPEEYPAISWTLLRLPFWTPQSEETIFMKSYLSGVLGGLESALLQGADL